jgi:hypothetical protein
MARTKQTARKKKGESESTGTTSEDIKAGQGPVTQEEVEQAFKNAVAEQPLAPSTAQAPQTTTAAAVVAPLAPLTVRLPQTPQFVAAPQAKPRNEVHVAMDKVRNKYTLTTDAQKYMHLAQFALDHEPLLSLQKRRPTGVKWVDDVMVNYLVGLLPVDGPLNRFYKLMTQTDEPWNTFWLQYAWLWVTLCKQTPDKLLLVRKSTTYDTDPPGSRRLEVVRNPAYQTDKNAFYTSFLAEYARLPYEDMCVNDSTWMRAVVNKNRDIIKDAERKRKQRQVIKHVTRCRGNCVSCAPLVGRLRNRFKFRSIIR